MKVLDLCCGLGGFSAAWVKAGHNVVKVDIDPRVRPHITADVRELSPQDYTGFDVILAAPPCTEYSRCDKSWLRHKVPGGIPDFSIWQACCAIANHVRPRAFVLENVRGAIAFHGKPRASSGARFFWGWFPPVNLPSSSKRELSSSRWVMESGLTYGMNTDERRYLSRSFIEPEISQVFLDAIIGQAPLPLFPAAS